MFSAWMTYGDFKDLTRRTASVKKILRDKAFNFAKNPKYDECQRRLASMVYKSFDEKTSGGTVKNWHISNKELHKPDIKKSQKRKLQSRFIDNIWVDDLADMQFIFYYVSFCIKGTRFYYVLLTLIANMHGLFPWKIKKILQILMLSKKI